MPNHVINELIFRGVDTVGQDAILAATTNDEGKVDFGILVPMPINRWQGDVGSEHDKAFGPSGMVWARENWGTKWNAYSMKPIERTDDTLTLRFETAWAPPYPWLAAVLNSFERPFEHNWLDEGRERGRSGVFTFDQKWGPQWSEADATDEMHRHLHKLHFGVEEFTEQ